MSMTKRKLELASSTVLEDASDNAGTSAVKKPVKRTKVVASDFQSIDPAILPESAKLDLADAEIYYVEDFLCDEATARRWYEEIVELDTCSSISPYGHSLVISLTSIRRVPTYPTNVWPKLPSVKTSELIL